MFVFKPEHLENKIGTVFRSTGSWYEVRDDENALFSCRLKGKFKIKDLKVTNPLSVGDKVVFDLEDENIGIIKEILPRKNYIIRKSVHKTAHGHLLASNIDQLVLIVTLASPKTSLGFIDRFLVTAETFRIPVLIVFNKFDLLNKKGVILLDEPDAHLEILRQRQVFALLRHLAEENGNQIIKQSILLRCIHYIGLVNKYIINYI